MAIELAARPGRPEVLTRVKADLAMELCELATGLLLVGFLWTHMVFVGTILLGVDFFNGLAWFLDVSYLAYLAAPVVPALIVAHMFFAARKVPIRLREQRVAWSLARGMRSYEIWTWIFQIITGVALLALASVHIWIVVANYPIQADKSADRIIQSPFLIFYIWLLILGEFHAGVGLYRQIVKWGWFNRHYVYAVIKVIGVVMVGLGAAALVIFGRLGGTTP